MDRIMAILVEDCVTVVVPGHPTPLVATSDHPNYRAIVTAAAANDPGVIDLFDVEKAIAAAFEQLSERVSTDGQGLFLDGDELSGTLADTILEALQYGDEGVESLVLFLENLSQNPNPDAVTQLYDWIEASGQFTIDANGMIRGYKGVTPLGDGQFASISSGRAMVNGEVRSGHIEQTYGDVVTMPRAEVNHNPSQGCSTGLHVGTFAYANGFGSHLLEVAVNPRDVVSVPTDCDAQKMRTCRYEVIGDIAKEYDTSLAGFELAEFDPFDLDFWGEVDDEDDYYLGGDLDW